MAHVLQIHLVGKTVARAFAAISGLLDAPNGAVSDETSPLQDQGMPALERIAALLGGQCAPGRPGLVGGLDSQARMLGAEVRHSADQFTGGRVEDVLTGAIRRVQL